MSWRVFWKPRWAYFWVHTRKCAGMVFQEMPQPFPCRWSCSISIPSPPLLFLPGITTSLHIWGDSCGERWVSLRLRKSQVVLRVLRTPRSKTSLCHLRINFHLERKTCLLPTKQEHKCLLFKGVETVESTAGALIRPCLFTLNRS